LGGGVLPKTADFRRLADTYSGINSTAAAQLLCLQFSVPWAGARRRACASKPAGSHGPAPCPPPHRAFGIALGSGRTVCKSRNRLRLQLTSSWLLLQPAQLNARRGNSSMAITNRSGHPRQTSRASKTRQLMWSPYVGFADHWYWSVGRDDIL
jgi:hypothetical protein